MLVVHVFAFIGIFFRCFSGLSLTYSGLVFVCSDVCGCFYSLMLFVFRKICTCLFFFRRFSACTVICFYVFSLPFYQLEDKLQSCNDLHGPTVVGLLAYGPISISRTVGHCVGVSSVCHWKLSLHH
jgi:hypothetical protein